MLISHVDFSTRYAFRSTEKVALQEIGPRFTLKLRWLKKGIPAVYNYGEEPQPLAFDTQLSAVEGNDQNPPSTSEDPPLKKTVPPKQNEVLWAWKVGFFDSHMFCHA